MYATYFGLNENPFSITPDPRYLFLSGRYAEALAHLLYGVTESGGFIQLTGEVGTGKTTLVRSLLDQLPEHVDTAVILNPRIWRKELLVSICGELRVEIDAGASPQAIIDALNQHLLDAHARGRRTVLIIDEAQALSTDVLEQVRLLSNLETSQQKLLQIILIGQPELRELLARKNLRQLAQRITGRYHLQPLVQSETRTYIAHRLEVSGSTGTLFTPGAVRKIHRLAGGIPRLVNIICDRALLGAYARGERQINRRLAARAGREVMGSGRKPRLVFALKAWSIAVVLVGLSSLTVLAASGVINWPERSRPQVANVSHGDPAPVALVKPKPRPAERPTLSKWLARVVSATDTESAFTVLFNLWGKHYPANSGASGCQQAEEVGLRCLYQKGTWSTLDKFNRPAIIALTESDGTQYQVVVAALDKRAVTLEAGGKKQRFRIRQVSRDWSGESLLLWRPPPAVDHALQVGMQGASVHWLAAKLGGLQGWEKTSGNRYDQALAERVKQFQRAHHLTADGIAGKQTLIQLNTALDLSSTPYLHAPPKKARHPEPSLAQTAS
jgi:general secretion pathway protein A